MLLAATVIAVAAGAPLALQGPAAAAAEQKVNLETVIAKGAKPIKKQVTYRVYRLEPVYDQGLVGEFVGGSTEISLSSGRYRLITAYYDTTVYEDFEVNGKAQRRTVNLNAGRINMRAIPGPGGKPVKKGVRWEIYSFGKDDSGKRVLITDSRSAQAQFVLPAGFYIAKALVKGKEVKHTVEVNPGVTYDYTVVVK